MAKNYFDRYVWLIGVIYRHKYISKRDIDQLWQRSPLNEKRDSELPERTFHNHREAIRDTFGIEIKCDRSLGYYIANSEDLEADGIRQWLLESLSMNNLLSESRDMRDRILFEKIPSSQRWLSVIVNAMRDGKVVEMSYQSFGNEAPSSFKAKPYCLKLFRQRWYVLALSEGKDEPWIYALDERMKDVSPTRESYKLPKKFNADRFFADAFGIIVDKRIPVQTIKIKVFDDQVKYFDSLPLHDSQKKIPAESNKEYSVYTYHLSPAHDFKKEILSWGSYVEVLSPEGFREEIRAEIAEMAKQYGL